MTEQPAHSGESDHSPTRDMPAIILTEPEWKQYEDLVCEMLQERHPDWTIERDIRIVGYRSEGKRQIDIAMRGKLGEHDILVVVDCKHHREKVDINTVGSFIDLLDDVSADIGILVTPNGYTKAAETTAKKSRIKLEIKTLEELKKYRIELNICHECEPGEDHLRGTIIWYGPWGLDGDVDKIEAVGRCDWCNTLHVRCLICGSETGIPDVYYGEPVECSGECGTVFVVNHGHPKASDEIQVRLPDDG